MMNMREMLGESGRTMSNIDRDTMSNRQIRNILGESGRTISNMDRAIAAGMGSPMMSDNEPRMEDRDQVFSIEARIQNLLKSYQMFIDDQDFYRAQQVANEINMLDVQKKQAQAQQANAQAQAQNVPQMRMGGIVPPTPSVESTDTRMTSFLRKYAITPHLMDVGFFQEPSFDRWVQATKSANKAGSPIPYVSPMLSDSIDALKVGYDAFVEDFNKSRQTAEPQEDEISRILDSISS
tara:strand:- start:1557 stop:2267 length:711 start_codon:yes stop_codon:yes gene_type:complete